MTIKLEIYLDNSATTCVCNEAIGAVNNTLNEIYGNPSAVHNMGIRAKEILENSRKQIAQTLSADTNEIYFSHSGTLSNNTAIFGAVNARKKMGNRIITTL